MFDADAGREASTQKINQLTDRFAAEFQDRMKDLSMADQEALIERLVAVMSATDTARDFATNSAGQPAAALGAGGTPPLDITTQQALTALATHEPRLGVVLQRLALGLENPNANGALVINQNGEIAETVAARQEATDKETARAAVAQELAEERDANHNGSLAHQLASAQADVKATVLPLVVAIETAAGNIETSFMSSHVDGTDELDQAIRAAKAAVS